VISGAEGKRQKAKVAFSYWLLAFSFGFVPLRGMGVKVKVSNWRKIIGPHSIFLPKHAAISLPYWEKRAAKLRGFLNSIFDKTFVSPRGCYVVNDPLREKARMRG
jgi:hypothetical protein